MLILQLNYTHLNLLTLTYVLKKSHLTISISIWNQKPLQQETGHNYNSNRKLLQPETITFSRKSETNLSWLFADSVERSQKNVDGATTVRTIIRSSDNKILNNNKIFKIIIKIKALTQVEMLIVKCSCLQFNRKWNRLFLSRNYEFNLYM